MATGNNVGLVRHGAAASDDFYGDSDADENPFEHDDSSQDGLSNNPFQHVQDTPNPFAATTTTTTTTTTATLRPGQWNDYPSNMTYTGASNGPAAAATGPGSFSALARNPADTSWNTRSGVTSNIMLSRRLRDLTTTPRIMPHVDMVDTEVETETEGEMEGDEDDSGSEDGHGDRANSSAAAAVDWSNNDDSDWIALVDEQLGKSRMGQADPHAMRHLLRAAGFVPPSRRKDVWRLLILGRVEAGSTGGDIAFGGNAPQHDILALESAILSTELDLDNQRVVRVDVERTRPALEQFKRPRVKNLLARLLTHHCKTHGLGYKQGMHEVLAPFVALSDPELPTSDISLCYGAFIKRFLPYAFNKDEEFLSLQICFRLFRLLLLYHHPRLCRFLDQYQLQPELYATPWFLTLFSNSLDLPRLYEVWDFYLFWGDPALHHFVVLAFVIGNADVILQAEEANLPETMCRLSVGMRSVEELRMLMRTGKDLMLNTPKSFRKILRSALYANLSQNQMKLVLSTLQVSSCIPVSAEEVISYILHKNPHRQLDQESDEESIADDMSAGSSAKGKRQFLRPPTNAGVDSDRGPASPQRVAERAAMRSLRGHRQYIIMDCRPKAEFESCRLAPALHLDPDLLVSPDDLDAKLKEFMPLQGVAHFCLVGAGGETGPVGHKRRMIPSDLSGEAMGLMPTSFSKGDTSGGLDAAVSKSDRTGEGGDSVKPEVAVTRDNKDGGFNWMGGFSRALNRGQDDGSEREGEEEVGREEDVQVARFVLMLLQYNFPFISHVRGDMAACLQELSAQALDEKKDEPITNGGRHETLDGVLIGANANMVREGLTTCSPEKKLEGLFAGLTKWSKDKGESGSSTAGGGDGSDRRGRRPSWRSKEKEALDRGYTGALAQKKGDGAVQRGRGGMGRRDDEDLFVEVVAGQDAEAKPSKRRLFGGVLNRFDRSDKAGDGAAHADSLGSPRPKDVSSFPSDARKWLTPSGSRASKREAAAVSAADLASRSTPIPEAAEMSSPESEAYGGTAGNAHGTWVKPGRTANPDRFTRFLGKMLGVRDDALPDGQVVEESVGAGGGGALTDAPERESIERDASSAGEVAPGTAVARARSGRVNGATDSEEQGAPTPSGTSTAAAAAAVAATRSAAEATPVTATAVYPATTISTAAVDAMPIAVAVAMPVADGVAAVESSEPTRPSRRPSRTGRSNRTAEAVGSSVDGAAVSPAGTGETVSISEWVVKEQRETGGPVRVFSAQRVLEGKAQKRCRLAVSRKNMTQFDNIQDGDRSTGGTRGVISEHRGLRHLSRITSRKKHAELIVFHFKSRSAGASTTAPSASAAGGGADGSLASRRARARPSPDNEAGQPDVLFYFMREHSECLRMVKENYRNVTQGVSGGGGGSSSFKPAATGSSSTRRNAHIDARGASSNATGAANAKSGRQAARAAAGAAAGAAGIMVGAAAGVAVGAAAGVAVGAAFLAGHRKGSEGEIRATSSSPSRLRRRGGSDGPGGLVADAELRRNAEGRRGGGGWIPIGSPGEEKTDASGRARPSSATVASSRRGNISSTTGSASGLGRGARGGESSGASGSRKAKAGAGPTWLGRG